MKVLSLFDGISCARVALERAGIAVEKYYACEIDKNAIKVSETNYPDIVRLGDVREVKGFPVDLLIGGSPCQDLSIAKKDRKGLDGERSGLFWEYVRLWKECKPRWFILENVASMPKADRDIITREMGVEPVMINAALVSAQNRKRLFWTNIPFKMPEDRGIALKDILQPDGEVDERMVVKGKAYCLTATYANATATEAGIRNSVERKQRTLVTAVGAAVRGNTQTQTANGITYTDKLDVRTDDKANALTPTFTNKLALVKVGYVGEGEQYGQGGQAHRVYSAEGKTPTLSSFAPLVKLGHIGNSDSQGNRVYDTNGKSCTLSANGGGLDPRTGLYAVGRDNGRRLNAEGHREDSNKDIPIQRRIEIRTDDKCGTLTSVQKDNLVVREGCIRKLTPIECERLQSLPDDYTTGIAMTNRYRCLGNAFNVEVIVAILRGVAEQELP
jgi:DNA (cytosine-5)-methyltransferase 3A